MANKYISFLVKTIQVSIDIKKFLNISPSEQNKHVFWRDWSTSHPIIHEKNLL